MAIIILRNQQHLGYYSWLYLTYIIVGELPTLND